MDPIDISLHVDAQGKANPLTFTWRGSVYRITAVGRRWQADDGEHILVMVAPADRVFELLHPPIGPWQVVKPPPTRLRA